MANTPFVPLEFPFPKDKININAFLLELTEASKKIGEFNAKLKGNELSTTYAQNHLVRLESLYSTRIEGTQTTIDAVYEADVDASKGTSPDVNEVVRYNQALTVASERVMRDNITMGLIKGIHKILLEGKVRKNSNFVAGEFRTQQNKVGPHIPPIATRVPELMGNLENYINAKDAYDKKYKDNLPSLIKAALIHAQFETIHPFPDGNGRVGRVLIPIYLYKEGEIDSPYFFISQELEKNATQYYAYLQGTRQLTEEGFSTWIRFFLHSVIRQADKNIQFIDNINELYKKTMDIMQKCINSNNNEAFIKSIFKYPIFTTQKLYEETGINQSSLRNYIRVLEKENVLFSNQQRRNRRYHFIELLDLFR